MLTRLLSNLDQIEACLLSSEGDTMGGEGQGNITLFHRAMKMATTLKIGRIDEMWFEGEATTVATAIRGGGNGRGNCHPGTGASWDRCVNERRALDGADSSSLVLHRFAVHHAVEHRPDERCAFISTATVLTDNHDARCNFDIPLADDLQQLK